MGNASGAAAAAVAQATKASGVIVSMEPEEFQRLLYRIPEPVVVTAEGGAFKKHRQYLTSYRGLAFFTKSATQLHMPSGAEVIAAKSIWIP